METKESMESKQKESVTMTGEEFALYVSRPQVRIFAILLLVVVAAVVGGVRHGFATREVMLIVGAVTSGIATAVFGKQLMIDAGAEQHRSFIRASRAAAAFVPLLLAFYLALYEGAWRLLGLLTHFSISSLIARILFLFLGYR